MKSPAFLVLLPLLAIPASAIETRWTATGTVTNVIGSGLTATVGTPVSLKFSYDSGASVYRPTSSAAGTVTTYYGPVKLSMEAVIGENKWSSTLLDGPLADVIYVEASAGGVQDFMRVTTNLDNGSTFGSFPYTGTATDRSLAVELRDSHSPALFLSPGQFPNDSVKLSSLSTGKGEIKAGTALIRFSINLASLTVETGTPFKVTVENTATGIRLRWPTETGVFYILNESENCKDWDLHSTYNGDGQERVVEITDPFTDHPLRCFYQVESE